MLRRALVEACRYTFNAITVDGESSTNDCVFALASGASGVRIDEELYPALFEGFRAVALELALGIVRGGEGATKLIAITVSGAGSQDEAWTAARVIANSPLVKTAIHGGDPNWGRLVAAAGRVGRDVLARRRDGAHRPARALQRRPAARHLAPQAADYLQGKELEIEVNVGAGGSGRATIYTCDLSAEYVQDQRGVPDLRHAVQSMGGIQMQHGRFDASARRRSEAALQGLPVDSRLQPRRAARRPSSSRSRLKRERSLGLRAPTSHALDGRHIGLLFEKPSLRTRVTFTIGVRELGGDMVEIPADVMHADREPIHDVARNLERWVDAVVIRTFSQDRLVQIGAVDDAAARHQRAVRRAASLPGAGRHADAVRALGHA